MNSQRQQLIRRMTFTRTAMIETKGASRGSAPSGWRVLSVRAISIRRVAAGYDRGAGARSAWRTDYAGCRSGNSHARDGVRWHLIDRGGGYDWSSWMPMVEARARENPGDLGSFPLWLAGRSGHILGAPSWIVSRGLRGSGADSSRETGEHAIFAGQRDFLLRLGGDPRPDVSLRSWRDGELKRQLVRADIAAIEGIRDVDPPGRASYLLNR